MLRTSAKPVRDLSNLNALPPVLRVDEVARLLGRSEASVYYLISAKKLQAIRPFEKSRRILGIRREAILCLLGE